MRLPQARSGHPGSERDEYNQDGEPPSPDAALGGDSRECSDARRCERSRLNVRDRDNLHPYQEDF